MKHVKLFEQFVNESDAYLLSMLADKTGTGPAAEFLKNNKIDLEATKKAIQQGVINKYDLRDVVKGTAAKSITKKVMKVISESVVNEKVSFGKAAIKAKLQDKLEIAQKAIDKWGDSYQGVYDRVEKAAKTGKIDVNNIFYVQGAEPQNDYEIFNGTSASQLASEIHKILKKYKKYEVEGSSRPAMAGWSGTMRSTVGGGIDGHINFSNGKNTYLVAVTVGGGVDRSIREKIFQEVYELMFVFDEYNSSDGGVSIDMDSGTNYHTLGIKRRGESFVRSFADRLQQTIDLG